MNAPRFNIRVYGFLTDDRKVLVTDEFRLGVFMTKFPGGGLQFGEGTIDCLKREFLEELHVKIEVISHYYTTDFFQPTVLLPSNQQLISIYYRVSAPKPYLFPVTDIRYDIPEIDGAQSFRWLKISDLSENEFTFPVDKYISRRLRDEVETGFEDW
ncbi:MAG: NUDIX domain-containing protein [Bacteroidales bacterium]|nr:NUDIX domain-containing protein [Bacteroidales bacterium]